MVVSLSIRGVTPLPLIAPVCPPLWCRAVRTYGTSLVVFMMDTLVHFSCVCCVLIVCSCKDILWIVRPSFLKRVCVCVQGVRARLVRGLQHWAIPRCVCVVFLNPFACVVERYACI